MQYYSSQSQYHPDMSADAAARVWMKLNECADNGLAAIYDDEDGMMSVNYQETPHGIIILLHNGTGLPVPYKYDGSTENLLN